MKRISLLILGLLLISVFTLPAEAGTLTTNKFLYKPSLGARGDTEKQTFDAGLDRIDARLGKEIWLGDPNVGSTLQTAIAAIGNTPVILRIPSGSWDIPTNLTIPANVAVKVERGGTFSGTGTLTIAGPLEAGLYQICNFSTGGKLVLAPTSAKEVYPQWFGAKGGGITDDSAALQATINSLPYGGRIYVFDGTYILSAELAILEISHLTIEGQSRNAILDSSATTTLTHATFPGATRGVYGTISIDTTSTTTTVKDITLRNLTIKSCGNSVALGQKTVYVGLVDDFRMENCIVYTGCNEGVYHQGWGNSPSSNNFIFRNNIFRATSSAHNGSFIDVNTEWTYNTIIDGNDFEGPAWGGVTDVGRGTKVINNQFSKFYGTAIYMNEGTASESIVANNVITDLGYPGGTALNCKGIAINNATNTQGVLVTGNVIKRLYGNSVGILIKGPATVSNNLISNAMEALSGGGAYGIEITANATSVGNIYLDNNRIEATSLATKFYIGIAIQQESNLPNVNLFINGGSYDNVTIGLNNGGGTYHANVSILNSIINGPIYGQAGNIASVTPATNVPFTGNTKAP